KIARDRLALAALLGADTGIGTLSVDQRDERQPEALRETHQAQRLAISLGLRHPVVATHPLLRVAALLVSDHHDGAAVDAAEAADDRLIVGKHAIAVQLAELRAD